ncbi:tyrosine-type recombinase/integrase [Gemmatimonadota bacterium]
MAAPEKLTERRIERLRYDQDGPSRQIHWDEVVPGFGVRVYPSGRQSYVLHYGEASKRRLLTLGKVGVITLSQARDQARELLVSVANGADPLEERERRRAAREGAITVEALVEEFLLHHESRWSPKHHRESARRLRSHVLPVLGSARAEDITRADVNRLHAQITERGAPIEANRIRTLLHTMFEWGMEFGQLPESHPNPARHRKGSTVGRNPEGSRSRFLKREEAPRLLRAADSTGNPLDGVIVRLWLLTGLRKSELLHRRWSDVNLRTATLTVPKTKNGREHTLPLSGRAVELLRTLPRPVRPDAPLFPGADPSEPISDFKRPWARIQGLSGLDDLTIHDLRRTVGTWLASLAGVPVAVVAALLNHKPPGAGVTAIYARPMEEAMREAVEELEGLLAQVEPYRQGKEVSNA